MQTIRTQDPTMPHRPTGPTPELRSMRSAEFRPRRSVWPGLLVAALIAAGITAAVVSSREDSGPGPRADATVAAPADKVNPGTPAVAPAGADAADGAATTSVPKPVTPP